MIESMSIEFLLTIYQMVFMLCTFMIVYMLLLKSRKTSIKDLQKESIRFISQWNSPELVKISTKALNYKSIERLKLYYKELDTIELENYQDIITILNFMEEMALYVDNRLVDERILRKYFSQTVLEIYKTFEKYIYTLRAERQNPTLYRQFERLVNTWIFSNN